MAVGGKERTARPESALQPAPVASSSTSALAIAAAARSSEAGLGFSRIVAAEIEVPNMLAILV